MLLHGNERFSRSDDDDLVLLKKKNSMGFENTRGCLGAPSVPSYREYLPRGSSTACSDAHAPAMAFKEDAVVLVILVLANRRQRHAFHIFVEPKCMRAEGGADVPSQ
jgi:hypothetical protein